MKPNDLPKENLLAQAIALRDLLEDESSWTKGTSVRNANQRSGVAIEEGCSFCLLGGIAKVIGHTGRVSYERVGESSLGKLVGGTTALFRPDYSLSSSIHRFNDIVSTRHEELMALLDCVVEQAEMAGV